MNFELKKDMDGYASIVYHFITKTKFIIFHAPNKPKFHITILINNKAIDEVKYKKYWCYR